MPHKCSATNCYSHSVRDKQLSFHVFPDKKKEPQIYVAWLSICPVDFQPKKDSRICSNHFTKSCHFYTPKKTKRKLFVNAIPDALLSPTKNNVGFVSTQTNVNEPFQFNYSHQQPTTSHRQDVDVERSHSHFDNTSYDSVNFQTPVSQHVFLIPRTPLKRSAVETPCSTPKKKWKSLYLNEITGKAANLIVGSNPLIDDLMSDDDVDCVLQAASLGTGSNCCEKVNIFGPSLSCTNCYLGPFRRQTGHGSTYRCNTPEHKGTYLLQEV